MVQFAVDILIRGIQTVDAAVKQTIDSLVGLSRVAKDLTGITGKLGLETRSINEAIRSETENTMAAILAKEGFVGTSEDAAKITKAMNSIFDTNIKVVDEATGATGKFSMALLGTGFFGMMLGRTFGFLNKQIMEMYFSAELMNIQFTMITAMEPLFMPLVDTFYALTDVFYGLPAPVQQVVGGLFSLLGIFGDIIGTVAFTLLGINQLGPALVLVANAMAGVTGFLSAFFIPILAIIAILAVLWLAWQTNFANIRQFAAEVWEGITNIIKGAIDIITGIFDVLVGIVTLDWEKIDSGVSKIVGGFKTMIVDGFWKILQAAADFGVRIVITIVEAFQNWISKIPGFLGEAWDKLSTWFGNLISSAREWGVSFVNNIIEGVKSVGSQIASTLMRFIPESLRGIVEVTAKALGAFGLKYGVWHGQFGGIVPGPFGRPVPAILHGGEAVIPRGEGAASIVNYSPTIYITTGAISREIDIRDLARQIGEFTQRDLRRMI